MNSFLFHLRGERRRRRSSSRATATTKETTTKEARRDRKLNKMLASKLVGLLLLLLTTLVTTLVILGQVEAQVNSINQLQQSLAKLLQVFPNANESQPELNHFRLLERAGDSLLVGARNVVYNLSLNTMREQRRLEWPSSEEDIKLCRVKGKSLEQCQNYIRVLKLQAPDTLFVCGTNAYKPRCRTYIITNDAYALNSEMPGEGACPYQENQNVTSLFAEGSLYSATAAQFSGIDGLIHRAPLRTEQFNPKQLNSPNFVSSFRYGEHVYFLFRESAIEHINCGKTIYSRIARVCINDSGGLTRANRERWTSFVKARLNCSIPGEYPFYFDEIQASTQIVSSATSNVKGHPQAAPLDPTGQTTNPNNDLLYAVFTTPINSIGGSAVCAFRMSDVLAAFEGPFKAQVDSNSNWLPVPESRVPQPRPGTCVNDSKLLPDENINFIKDNPLMDQAVESVWSQPIVMMASINFRFTQIAVDSQVETQFVTGAQSMRTDVIFVATDDGRVFKLTNTHHLYAAAASQHQQQQQRVQQPLPVAYPLGLPTLQPYYSPPAAQRQPLAAGSGGFSSQGGSIFRASPSAARLVSAQVANNQPEPLTDVSGDTIVIEELHLFDSRTPILNLLIHYPTFDSPINSSPELTSMAHPKLIVLAGRQIKAVPLSRCERALTCADCLALYDPYCAWDTRQQACLSVGRSMAPQPPNIYSLSHSRHQMGQQQAFNWFPPNSLTRNNFTLAWWLQCPATETGEIQQQQRVGNLYRSLFSSHLQVPSRFDYASGHHLSQTALLSLSNSPAAISSSLLARQQPVSECLTFCGGIYSPQPLSSAGSYSANQASSAPLDQSSSLPMNCADYIQQQHYIGGNLQSSSGNSVQPINGGSLYTSESLYFAVIICAISGLVLGLLFGFAIGRNTKKHDSSICSSTFDETNLYMASTGSHHGANLFAAQQQQQQRLQHPLLAQHTQALLGTGSVRPNMMATHHSNHPLFEANQCLLHETNGGGNYGNQQQMLLHLNGSGNLSNGQTMAPQRTGNLPPVPTLQQQQAPLVNTSSSSTHINHSQLTPNSIGSGANQQASSISSGSSTNTSSTSATVPASDHHHQLYLNQQQLLAAQPHQQQHQRSFTTGGGGNKGSGRLVDTVTNKLSSGKNQPFLQPQQQQQHQQQQNNKSYL